MNNGTASPDSNHPTTSEPTGTTSETDTQSLIPADGQPPDSSAPNSDAAANGDLASALANLKSDADLQKFLADGGVYDIPTDGTEATVEPVTTEAAESEEERVKNRIRIKHLPPERQDLIRKLAENPAARLEDFITQPAPVESAPPPMQSETPVGNGLEVPARPAESSASLQAQIDDLRSQKRAAMEAFQTDRIIEIERGIDALRDRLPNVIRAEAEYEVRWSEGRKASDQQVSVLYPEAFDPNSEFHKEATRIFNSLNVAGNPLADEPDLPMLVAVRVATKMGIVAKVAGSVQPTAIAPKSPTARPFPVSIPAPRAVVPGVTPPSPASGAARTQAPAPDAEHAQARALLDSAKDSSALDALLMGIR